MNIFEALGKDYATFPHAVIQPLKAAELRQEAVMWDYERLVI